ncbi:hypothetical protein Ddye_026248 [Dipteronia dyeriana]|uniref:DUF4283 domain-containing protein n=1 Tax=Dipteronia dyeriana TaxID=168575 RepID=A0AAD9TMN0_9ROSI|nr:hypothetical protein Ddye_026248 [Dipteronia dyeriana]
MKSYAQSISSAIAPVSLDPKKNGDYVAIKVNPKAYEERLKLCSYSLIGRVVLLKGDEPWKVLALKEKLQSFWKLNSQWRLISLGRGFFQILLNSEEEKAKFWGIGPLHLKPGTLRLQPWTQNFNPNTAPNECPNMGAVLRSTLGVLAPPNPFRHGTWDRNSSKIR